MQKKYFGTDGIRGRSNTNSITPEIMIKLAMATTIACDFAKYKHKPTIVIGKDTRLSGYMLEFALTSGFISMGVNIILVGPIPTPAVSMLIKSLRADLGMVISASHNPYYDNGIKFFDSTGYKISEDLENTIEKLMTQDLSSHVAHYNDLGKAVKLEDARGRYIEYVKHSFPDANRLDGMKIVVDCANGAAYDVAPKVFHELGAEVITWAVSPNGFNINHQCGVLDSQALAAKVLEHKAHLGIALDGDADRILIIDENGCAIDGDQIIAAIAVYLLSIDQLQNSTVVTTIMSNMGLELFLKEKNICLIRANVGDKHVVKKMLELRCSLGGEQSGHIIIGEHQATGDGIKVALQILAMYKKTEDKTISQLLKQFTPIPQISHNIYYDHKYYEQQSVLCKIKLSEIMDFYQQRFIGVARIVIRPSGTEPIIRIMVECKNTKQAEDLIAEIQSKILQELHFLS